MKVQKTKVFILFREETKNFSSEDINASYEDTQNTKPDIDCVIR